MEILGFIFGIDSHLESVISLFGVWTYVILFAVIFAETGLVVAPFLPGDSLLFAVGAFSAAGFLDITIVYVSMIIAAILGDTVNYWIGNRLGPKVFSGENSKLFKKAYLEKTREFYEKHGGKTIILARFMPILRTFAPFVAGVGSMHYRNFLLFNVVGAFVWVTSITFAGYFFGAIPWVKDNFEYVVVMIIAISFAPLVFEYVKYKLGPSMSPKQLERATHKDVQETFKKEHLND